MAEATKTPRKMTKVSDTSSGDLRDKSIYERPRSSHQKRSKSKRIKRRDQIYLNAEQRAAYYTVDGQGSDDFKVDLTTLAE